MLWRGGAFSRSTRIQCCRVDYQVTAPFLSEVVDGVITELQASGLLCNTRYGEAFCRSRVERGYGPVFMQRELEHNGLNKELIETLLEPYNEQWLDKAIMQVEKQTRTHRPANRLSSQLYSSPSDNSENAYTALDCSTQTITGELHQTKLFLETGSVRHGMKAKKSARASRGI